MNLLALSSPSSESHHLAAAAPSPEALLERFLAAQDVSAASRETYRRELRQFFAWLTENAPAERTLGTEDLLAFKASLAARGLTSLTVTNYVVAVRKFFTWCASESLYPDIARGVKGAKRSRDFLKDPLTTEQAQDLLRSIDRTTPEGKRDFALVNLLLRTGLRTIEVVRADVGDLRQIGGEAKLYVQGKGRDAKDAFVVLTPAALGPLREYLQTRGALKDADPLFVSSSNRNAGGRLTTRSVRRLVKGRFEFIAISDRRLTTHSTRHTAITLALKGGASLQEAQALARHANINTTLLYAHNLDRVQNAAERRIDAILGA